MKVFRALAGALLWIVSGVISLVGVILCVTIILLPLGIPLLKLGTRMFGQAMRLFMPRELSHPVDAASRSVKGLGHSAKDRAEDSRKSVRKAWKKGRKAVA